jgi:hypothetical protein
LAQDGVENFNSLSIFPDLIQNQNEFYSNVKPKHSINLKHNVVAWNATNNYINPKLILINLENNLLPK